MRDYENWCADKLVKLLTEELRISTLNEIKDEFKGVPQEDANNIAESLQLPLVFDCLNNSNNEQIDLACEVLTLCMNSLCLGESTQRYGVALERALTHPHFGVKLMALGEIARTADSPALMADLNRRDNLLNNIIKCIGNEELTVAKAAIDIITALGKLPLGIRNLLDGELFETIRSTMALNEIVRLRFYEMFVALSIDSHSAQRLLIQAQILPEMLSSLDNSDVLFKLNVIEILSQLVTTSHGYDYLESQNVMNRLFQSLNSGDILFAQICEQAVIKYFGTAAHWKPAEFVHNYKVVLDKIFENLESGDMALFGVSLDALGHIAGSNEGRFLLNELGSTFLNSIRGVWSRLGTLPSAFQVRASECVENILRPLSDANNKINEITRMWYRGMADDPMERIMVMANNPFLDIRSAGLKIILALAGYNWGQDVIKNTPGLVELLLNRLAESTKECKEIKYSIIKALMGSPVFDQHTNDRFQQYVNEGIFYVQPTIEVATEGD